MGHDAMFPEAARAFGVKGADLICVPAALKYPRVASLGPTDVPFADPIIREADDVHWHLLRSRSGRTMPSSLSPIGAAAIT